MWKIGDWLAKADFVLYNNVGLSFNEFIKHERLIIKFVLINTNLKMYIKNMGQRLFKD